MYKLYRLGKGIKYKVPSLISENTARPGCYVDRRFLGGDTIAKYLVLCNGGPGDTIVGKEVDGSFQKALELAASMHKALHPTVFMIEKINPGQRKLEDFPVKDENASKRVIKDPYSRATIVIENPELCRGCEFLGLESVENCCECPNASCYEWKKVGIDDDGEEVKN